MKKKILLVAGSLLAISNMIYADLVSIQNASDDEVKSLSKHNNYRKDDLTVNIREKKISNKIPTEEKPQSYHPKRVEKAKDLSNDQYIYQYEDSNGTTIISNKPKDSSFKLIRVTVTRYNSSERDVVNPVLPKKTKDSLLEQSSSRIIISE